MLSSVNECQSCKRMCMKMIKNIDVCVGGWVCAHYKKTEIEVQVNYIVLAVETQLASKAAYNLLCHPSLQ